jgi:hypothetical protein
MDINEPVSKSVPNKQLGEYHGLGSAATPWNDQLNVTRVWQATHPPKDMLDMVAPVWITDFQFLNKEGTFLATCTAYHEVYILIKLKHSRYD